jgi:hypothetical protein
MSMRDGPLESWQKELDAFFWEVDKSDYATAEAMPKPKILSQFGSKVKSVYLNVTENPYSDYEKFAGKCRDVGRIMHDLFPRLARMTIEDQDVFWLEELTKQGLNECPREDIEAARSSEEVHATAKDWLSHYRSRFRDEQTANRDEFELRYNRKYVDLEWRDSHVEFRDYPSERALFVSHTLEALPLVVG